MLYAVRDYHLGGISAIPPASFTPSSRCFFFSYAPLYNNNNKLNFISYCWQRGCRSESIEDLTARYFAEFAPYAGADQQQISLARVHDGGAVMGMAVEDGAAVSLLCRHPRVGLVHCDVSGEVSGEATLRVPLRAGWAGPAPAPRPPSSTVPRMPFAPLQPSPCVSASPQCPVHVPDDAATLGEMAVWGVVPHPERQPHGVGLRAGPLAVRVARAPLSEQDTSEGPLHSLSMEAGVCLGSRTRQLQCGVQLPLQGRGDALVASAVECRWLRLLLVHTLSTDTDGEASKNSRDLSASGQKLPTLLAASASVWPGGLQAHGTAMIQPGQPTEAEGALALRLSALLPFLPHTVLRVGVNDRLRLAAGLTSQLSDKVRVTLGLHKERGKAATFGLHFQPYRRRGVTRTISPQRKENAARPHLPPLPPLSAYFRSFVGLRHRAAQTTTTFVCCTCRVQACCFV
eukprot:gene10191-7139_t